MTNAYLRPTSAILLAAGKGTRMLSEKTPKALHQICGLPLLEYPLRATKRISPEKIAVVVGFGSDQVKKCFASENIIWAVQEKQLGTAHAALAGVQEIPEHEGDIIILSGNLPHIKAETLRKIINHHQQTEADATILVCKRDVPAGYARIIRNDHGQIINIIQDSDASDKTKELKETNTGVYVYKASVLKKLLLTIQQKSKKTKYYLDDTFMFLTEKGGKGETFYLEDERESDRIIYRADLARSSKRIFQETALEHMKQGVTIISPETTFIDKDVKIGRDSVILPFCVIKRGVTIGEKCEIGPFTHLREGSEIQEEAAVGNFTETKNTVLGRKSKAKHLSYLGDGQIGTDVNIGAGTIFANYNGKTKNKTLVEDKAFIGSGSILVAPIKVGKGAITGAGAVVPKNHNVEPGTIVVGVPAAPVKKNYNNNNLKCGNNTISLPAE